MQDNFSIRLEIISMDAWTTQSDFQTSNLENKTFWLNMITNAWHGVRGIISLTKKGRVFWLSTQYVLKNIYNR